MIMENQWFQYKYRTFNEIIERTNNLIDFSIIEIWLFLLSILFTFLMIYYIMPIIKIFNSSLEKDLLKKKKKRNLQKMLLQKDIENEIEEELEREKQEKLKWL